MPIKQLSVSRTFERQLTPEQLKAAIEEKLKSVLEQAHTEAAELENWWDLFAIGPIQPVENPAFAPHMVVKKDEPVYVATILWLNPEQQVAQTDAAHLLSDFSLPYEIKYQTCNLTQMQAVNPPIISTGHLVPGQYVYVDVQRLPSDTVGMFDTHVTARLLGADPTVAEAPHFGGFADMVINLDSLFTLTPQILYQHPVRFMVYP